MSETHHSQVLIVGSGAAGYTAAIYAARANRKPILVRGLQPGGQLTITTDVENYPGFADVIQGPWLMEQMYAQAQHVGARMFEDTIVEVDLARRPFRAKGDSGDTYTGDTLVVCTGASARWLGLESEKKFMGFGVSACATCDGFFFKGKRVAVIGGGNTAVEEALYLSNIARKVYLVHRRDTLRAEKIMQDKLAAKIQAGKIEPIWHHQVDEVLGNDAGVTGMRVRSVLDDSTREVAIHGLFVAIGHTPNTNLFEGQLEMKNGYLTIQAGLHGNATLTSVPGVFAAGDVADQVYRQAVTSAGFGCMAALDAEKFLDKDG